MKRCINIAGNKIDKMVVKLLIGPAGLIKVYACVDIQCV
jgi:hypothetical protein